MRRGVAGVLVWILVLLITFGSFVLFYHGVDQVMRLGLTHTLILRGEEGTADFTAVSDLPIYISGENKFDIVGEEVNFTVTLYDSEGVYLAHTDVYLYSPGTLVETLTYHEAIEYILTPGEQYTIEVIGSDFKGAIEQPHTLMAEFVMNAFYSGELVILVFFLMAVFWICMLGGLFVAGVDEIKTRRTKKILN